MRWISYRYLLVASSFQVVPVVEKTMNRSENLFFPGSSLASQVHAAAINGDKGALHKLIIGKLQAPLKYRNFKKNSLS